MNRDKYITRTIFLVGQEQRIMAERVLANAPIDPLNPLEFVIRERVRQRKLDQNSLMWVGPLKDISEQGYINGRRYSDVVWHEHFKAEFLPEEFDEELTKAGYKKWDYTPAGERVLVGSTTQLTVKGFALYLEQVYAFGANMGVMFHQARAA